jgi:glutamate dehydrogenase/leucine dehydrogenase
MVSVETDKAVVEIPAPWSGRIASLLARLHERLPVGAPLGTFGEPSGADTGTVVGSLSATATRLREIRYWNDYIPGPDMGTDEVCMAWIADEIGRAAGLPKALGGIPLDEIGATGNGLAVSIEAASRFAGFSLGGARVAVQGFGAVGQHAARFLAAKGARLVAAADSSGTVIDTDGLDVAALAAHKKRGLGLRQFPSGSKADGDAVIDVPCDI